METKIRLLDDTTINQIAAGEVIENASSVVKELVENSLDASATEITVEIKAGGRQLIRIIDNGIGMSPDDAILCLERHATSKIRAVEDVHSITTMGFRGEAIPSIASISKFTLLTRPKNQDTTGTMVLVEGGKIKKTCEVMRAPGTTIEIKNLFYNLPVRQKFQRSVSYDAGEIHKIISSIALGNPHVKFNLISQEKNILSIPAWNGNNILDGIGDRIKTLLGEGLYRNIESFDYKDAPYHFFGYLGTPDYTRHNRTGQYLYINGRPIFSSLISKAVSEGYSTRLATQRFPVFVVHAQLPGELFDVNVHPRKREVRFQSAIKIREAIINAVNAFFSGSHVTTTQDESEKMLPPLPWEEAEKTPSRAPPLPSLNLGSAPIPPAIPTFDTLEQEPWKPIYNEEPVEQTLPIKEEENHLIPIATIKDYILARNESDNSGQLIFLDQRAAHSRILFESFLNGSESKGSQSLLIPLTLELSPHESQTLETNLEKLEKMGIYIQNFGINTFKIDALPSLIKEQEAEEYIRKLLEELENTGNNNPFKHAEEKKLALAASRHSLPKGKCLDIEEATLLIQKLFNCDSSKFCPLGKPTMISFNSEDIAKKFKR